MVQDDTGWFLDVPRCSQMILDVPRCSQMFLVQDGSGFTISAKYHIIRQISQYQLKEEAQISTQFTFGVSAGEIGIGYSHNISQISQYQPNITISAKISQYRPNIPILTKFHNFSQISQFQPNITILTKFHNFSQIFYIFVNYSNSSNYQLPGPLF